MSHGAVLPLHQFFIKRLSASVDWLPTGGEDKSRLPSFSILDETSVPRRGVTRKEAQSLQRSSDRAIICGRIQLSDLHP
jgi:hypothetical protein